MSVQTTLANNGLVITNNQSDYPNSTLCAPVQVTTSVQQQQQPAQTSQLEITGVSRSSQSVSSQKESNRFRIVKTDADRKSESVDESVHVVHNSANQVQSGESAGFTQNVIPNNIFKTFSSLNGDIANKYQRGRWTVADFTTDNLPFNQALINGTTNAPINLTNHIKTDEITSYTNGYITTNQASSVNNVDQSKLNSINSNLAPNNVLITQNQAPIQNPIQLNQNVIQGSNYFIPNSAYSQTQPPQTTNPTYQIPSSIPSGTILNQSAQSILQTQTQINQNIGSQTPPIVANNNFGAAPLPTIPQTQPGTSLSSNLIVNGQQNQNLVNNIVPNAVSAQLPLNTDNTQSYKQTSQQNFPSSQSTAVNNSLPNQNIKIPSQPPILDNLIIGTSSNSQIMNAQVTTQQTSPKDSNLTKQQTNGLIISTTENIQSNQSSANDANSEGTDSISDTKKFDSGIHDRIAEAMDMVKSHLTQAVRDEIVALKNQIKQLKEQCSRLENENTLLKKHVPNDIVRQIENLGRNLMDNSSNNHVGNNLVTLNTNGNSSNLGVNENDFRNSQDSMTSSIIENFNQNSDSLSKIVEQ